MKTVRLFVALVLVAAAVAVAAAARAPAAGPLPELNIPYALDAWQGVDVAPLDAEAEQTLGADLVLNRAYAATRGEEAGLYIAYYNQQRPGISIHSPLHCLPGTGWDVVSNDVIPLPLAGGGTSNVRRLIGQKGATRIMVLYWYSINGRMIAGEFASRVQLLQNRVRLGRNDAALVRIAVPVAASDADAERRGIALARALLPHL
jgi:EpsI family protein